MRALAGREGVTSFKMFMAYPGRLMADDGAIFGAMRGTRDLGGLVMVHAENGGAIEVLIAEALRRGDTAPKFHALTRPPSAEREAAARAIALAEMAGAPVFIVHLSSAEALEAVRAGRRRGVAVFAETCPQYLCLSDAEYERAGFEAAKFVMSPPLRPAPHQEALWRGLAARDLDTVGTDHCPFGFSDPPHKQRGRDDFSKIPNGAPGIETRLMLLWDEGVRTGRITPERFVEITAAAPAKIFGLWPRKGTIAEGSDADIVLWDPDKRVTLSASTHHMRVDYSLYEGRTVTGAPETVLSAARSSSTGVSSSAAGAGGASSSGARQEPRPRSEPPHAGVSRVVGPSDQRSADPRRVGRHRRRPRRGRWRRDGLPAHGRPRCG